MIFKFKSVLNKFLKRSFTYTFLKSRAILNVKGIDTFKFLQGLVSNDISVLVGENSKVSLLYSGIFDSRGRIEGDIFIHNLQNFDFKNDEFQLYIDCCSKYSKNLIKLLNFYKLKSKVNITDVSEQFKLVNIMKIDDLNETQNLRIEHFIDPRYSNLGYRVIINQKSPFLLLLENHTLVDENFFKSLRYKVGICENSNEIFPKIAIPLEYNFDLLNARCYLGQELTARTKYCGIVRKRIIPVKLYFENFDNYEKNNLDLVGKRILYENKIIGEIKAFLNSDAVALVRLEYLEYPNYIFKLENSNITVKFIKPFYLEF